MENTTTKASQEWFILYNNNTTATTRTKGIDKTYAKSRKSIEHSLKVEKEEEHEKALIFKPRDSPTRHTGGE